LSRSKLRLKHTLGGLTDLRALPGVVFFNSARASTWGSGETFALHIPAAGIIDTDACPPSLLYFIPGNDAAFGSVLFANQLLAKTILISKMMTMVKVYQNFCDKLKLQALRLARRKERKRFRDSRNKNKKRGRRGRYWRN
jgi:ribosomal protein S2